MVSRAGAVRKEPPSVSGQAVRTARPIIALSSSGRITKANLQARRALGDVADLPLEGSQLGAALAGIMFGASNGSERIVLNLVKEPNERGERQEVLLVPSEADESASEMPTAEAASRESVDHLSQSVPLAGQISDFIAHELRNHLATMLGLSNFLETNIDTIAVNDRNASLRRIQAEAEDALLVLEGLLRLVETKRVHERGDSVVPLHSVIHRIVRAHRHRYEERTVIVSGDAPLFAVGNSIWIRIAITNLLNNAEKVTPLGQPIEVNVHQEANRAIVLVLDRGQALATPMYQELWDIYSKGPPPGLQISGTGIGLSLCKELVTAMGGKVWAGPRRDIGSAFAINLPVAQQPVVPGPIEPKEPMVIAPNPKVPAAA